MPYKRRSDLPARVKDNLPAHAEEIFQKAYNNAYKEYKDPSKRRGKESLEEVANKVAWAAVKNVYEKKDDKWQKKQ